ncbi:hypothetical protein IGI04_002514, partial [Brassica rapa subsp. trilocularis]
MGFESCLRSLWAIFWLEAFITASSDKKRTFRGFYRKVRLMISNVEKHEMGIASPWVGSELVFFDGVFLVIGLPSIFPARLCFQDMLSSQLISLVTLPFAMFATPDLDSVFLCVHSVCLEDYFWPQAWALISRWLSFILPPSGVFLFFSCFTWCRCAEFYHSAVFRPLLILAKTLYGK